MWRTLAVFDFKKTLFTKMTLFFIIIFCVITFSGLYAGTLKLTELSIVQRGNEKVVQVSNIGSFTDKLENILDRSYRFYHQDSGDSRAFFLASKLVEYWILSGVILILVYGYYSVVREKRGGVFRSLLGSPLTLLDYYWAKVISGISYWGAFLLVHFLLLGGLALILLHVSLTWLLMLFCGMMVLWGFLSFLWLIYLLLTFGFLNAEKVGALFLVLTMFFAFIVPGIIVMVSKHQVAMGPDAPRISQSSTILAFVPERKRTSEENALIEADLQQLIEYRENMLAYLTQGVQTEEQLAYFSPFLVVERVMKSYYRPEIVFYEDFLQGAMGEYSIEKIISGNAKSLLYLILVVAIFLLVSPVFIKKCEPV